MVSHARQILSPIQFFTLLVFAFYMGSVRGTNQSEENLAETLSSGTNVQPLKVDAPTYPLRALRQGVEGWVVLRFIVNDDGTTSDIEVVDASIEGYFENAAIKAARARIYKPATLQGKPVMQGNTQLRTIFSIKGSDGGVSKRFLRTYRTASKALDDGDLDQANKLIEKLDKQEKRLLAEVCYLDMLKARYFVKTGDDKATLRHVERALIIADVVAKKEIYFSLLRQGIVDNAKANNFQTSLKHYDSLLEVDKNLAPDDSIHNFVQRIRQVLGGDSHIVFEGKIPVSCKNCEGPDGHWWHVLNRNRFSIDQVVGQLKDIKIVCQYSAVTVLYKAEMAWTVNRDAGECSITVRGERGTAFRLNELPDASE